MSQRSYFVTMTKTESFVPLCANKEVSVTKEVLPLRHKMNEIKGDLRFSPNHSYHFSKTINTI